MTEIFEKILNARKDFKYWHTEIMGLEMAEHHKKIANVFTNFKKGLIIVSRGHGKTEELISRILHIVFYQNNKEIMLVSASLAQSYRVLERIKYYIDQNEILKVLRPKYAGSLDWEDWKETWSKQEIRTSTNCKVMCRPFNSSIRGNHVHYLFFDDVLRNDTGSVTVTPEQAKKIFVEDALPTINVHNGDLFILGTPINEQDLLYTIKNDIEGYEVVEMPCVKTDSNGKWLSAIWPSRFDICYMEKCDKCGSLDITSRGSNSTCNECGFGKINLTVLKQEMNKISPFSFEKEYMLNPVGSGASLFDADILKKQSVDMPIINKPRDNCYYYCGADIAMSQSNTADFTVICIIEEDENGVARLVKYDRFSGVSQTGILKRIQYWHRIFDFVQIMIEEKGLSYGMIRQANEDEMFNDEANIIKGLVEGFSTNRNNKERIIGALVYAFSVGNLFIPKDNEVMKELLGFSVVKTRNGGIKMEGRRVHDDIVMSLAMCYECFLAYSNSNTEVSYV